MYCPKCGHEQASETMRYCSRCGLSLDGVRDLLEADGDYMRREKLEVTGISLILVTSFLLLTYLVVLGATALPNLTTKSTFLTMWLVYLSVTLSLGTGGIVCLIRSGFFKKLKERQIRLQIAQLEQRKKKLESVVTGKLIEEKPAVQTSDFMSITETTTRNLEENERTPAKVRESQ